MADFGGFEFLPNRLYDVVGSYAFWFIDYEDSVHASVYAAKAADPLLAFVLDLVQQLFDANPFFHGLVIIEAEFRDAPHVMEPFAQRSSDKAGRGPQSFQGLLALSGIAKYGDEDASMPEIRRDFDRCDGRQTNPWVVDLALDDFTEFDP